MTVQGDDVLFLNLPFTSRARESSRDLIGKRNVYRYCARTPLVPA